MSAAEQTADVFTVFTKPFTENNKWVHALKLIGHTSSAHAGCKPVSSKGKDKVTVAALHTASKLSKTSNGPHCNLESSMSPPLRS